MSKFKFGLNVRFSPVLLTLLLLAVISTQGSADTKKKHTAARKAPGKVIHIAFQREFKGNYDPTAGDHFAMSPLYFNIYSTLFRLNTELKPYPFLVSSSEQSEGRITINIKEDANFSDGTPISAEDVAYSLEMGMSRGLFPSPVYRIIVGGEEFFNGKSKRCTGIRVQGHKRLVIRLKDKNAPLLYYLTSPALSILPRHRQVLGKSKKLVFSGAFKVKEQRVLDRETVVVLERNTQFPGRRLSKIDTLYFHYYHQPEDFEKAVHKGEPDMFYYNRPQRIPVSRYKYKYFKTPVFGAYYFKLNPLAGPFKDKRLRTLFKQFILSLNIPANTGWELTIPARVMLPHSLTGYTLFRPMSAEPPSNLIRDKIVKLRCINVNLPVRSELFPILKEKLQSYNFDLELTWVSGKEMLRRENTGEFDLTFYFFIVDVPLSSYFYRTLFTPGQELNRLGYRVSKAQEILASYDKEKDELLRLRLLAQLERIAQEESFVIPLMNPLYLVGYKKNIINVKMDKYSQIHFEAIDVEKRN